MKMIISKVEIAYMNGIPLNPRLVGNLNNYVESRLKMNSTRRTLPLIPHIEEMLLEKSPEEKDSKKREILVEIPVEKRACLYYIIYQPTCKALRIQQKNENSEKVLYNVLQSVGILCYNRME